MASYWAGIVAGLSALQGPARPTRWGSEPGVGVDLTIAGGQNPGPTDVHTYTAPGRRKRNRLSLADHDDIPAAVLALGLQRLDGAANLAVLPHLDRPDRLEGGVRPRPGVALLPLRAVPGHEQDLAESLVRLEPRVARGLLPGLTTVIERGEHGVEPAQSLLLGGERVPPLTVRVGCADLLELGGLDSAGDGLVPHPPCLAAFHQRGVVQVAVICQQPPCAALLGQGRVGAELVGSSHSYRSVWSGWGGPARCRLAGAVASRSYGPGRTFAGHPAEAKVLGFNSSLK